MLPVTSPPITDYDSLLYAAAFAFGLALGVHHVTVALTLPALAVIVYGTEGLRFFRSKRSDLRRNHFIRRAARGLRLPAACGVACAGHQLGQSAFVGSHLVARHRPAVSIVTSLLRQR